LEAPRPSARCPQRASRQIWSNNGPSQSGILTHRVRSTPTFGQGPLPAMVSSHSPSPALAKLARRLVQHEAERVGSPHDLAAGLQSTCDALYGRLSPLISALGFQTLFAQAITLAAREFQPLATLSVTAADSHCVLSGLAHPEDARATDDGADEALVAVLAHFLALLVLFIGEDLGLRTIRDVWPHVPLERSSSSGVES
jgi:hypothetical protein